MKSAEEGQVQPAVLLFDIDGTLIDTGGAGRRAMEGAFAARFGRADACRRIAFGGMTDRAILRAGLEAIGHDVTDHALAELVALYLARLAIEMQCAPDLKVHAGVERTLAEVASRRRCAVGLGTGNVREGARLKLSPVGLFDRFAFGGFGCDSEDRAELLHIGAARGAAALGAAAGDCRVVVIGDTPRDVAAARAIGAEAFAVASGWHGVDELAACAPTHLFASLDAPGVLDALMP